MCFSRTFRSTFASTPSISSFHAIERRIDPDREPYQIGQLGQHRHMSPEVLDLEIDPVHLEPLTSSKTSGGSVPIYPTSVDGERPRTEK